MQKKKNILLTVSFVVLMVMTGLLYWLGDNKGSIKIDKTIFRVEDFQSVNRIVLDRGGSKVDLSYSGSRWKVNDRFDADRAMIDVLFATLQQVEPKRAVTGSLADSIGTTLEKEGTKVTLYVGGNSALEFYTGGNVKKTEAYFKLKGGESFAMVIPGYRVYASGIFELPESGWKDKYVFGFNWRNFQQLEASFPESEKDNFKVVRGKDFFGVEGIEKADTANLNTFLDQVSLLTVDKYLEPGTLADSLRNLSPVMIISVRDIAKRDFTLKLFSPSGPGKPVLGLIGNSDPAFFDPRKITPLLRPRQFFVGK
jgi:hypothetical protein